MNHTELIEAIAKARHERWEQEGDKPWPCEFCIARTEDIMDGGWPLIVEFVAEWIQQAAWDMNVYDREDLGCDTSGRWREEMIQS